MPIGRFVAIALLLTFSFPAASRVAAQYQPPSDYLQIKAARASTWSDGATNVVQLQGPVIIQTDRVKMSADRAVIWLTPLSGTVLDQQRAEIALIGNAVLEQQQPQITRSGDMLYVTSEVRGTVRLTYDRRAAEDLSESDLYRDASAMRPFQNIAAAGGKPEWITQRPWVTTPPPAPPSTAPTTQEIMTRQSVAIQFGNLDIINIPDGTVAGFVSGGVTIVQSKPSGDAIQLQADRAVLYTSLSSLQEATSSEKLRSIEDSLVAAYLEGDVRITQTPVARDKAEQRMRAQRVYYEFATDQAVLTDVVIHTIDPQQQIPMVVRAGLVKQLSTGEYKAEKTVLTTSSFAVPSYSVNAERAYVRSYSTGDARYGNRTDFSAKNNVFTFQGLPLFYWPWAAGSMTDRGMPLRSILLGSGSGFGPGIRTNWGLFESLGQLPPESLDVSYKLDYFGERGPAGGVDASYKGGFITETSKQPWNFEGNFSSYFVNDHGVDRLARDRARVEPDENFRYQVLWEHQHFFPDDWQLQLRGSLVSDPTFLEEWFQRDFNNGLPHDESMYLKRQRQTEALTLAINFQPNDFVTNADQLQEQFEVEHLPEIGYYRIGDSVLDDNLTFFSANTVAGLHFQISDASYQELGFRKQYDPFPTGLPAGFPAQGQTGTTDDIVYRGDFRQEIDYPFSAGQFKVVPYALARPTLYSDSPDKGSENRFFVGTGVRMSTAFWRVDDTAYNELFDIHRVRHVVEPELHLFTSTQTVDRSDLFIYEEQVDAINDISAVQLALHQRWQTKRGGAGQWRSVDFFTLNLEANFFANAPDEHDSPLSHFRGAFFSSLPETSIPRNSINGDALWRVSDSTAILADAQYNLDEAEIATTSIGMAVNRESRTSYFMGVRYIDVVDSVIASFALNYVLTPKYSVQLAQSISLNDRRSENTAITVTRRFDRYFLTFQFYYDAVDDQSGFRVGLYPEGLGYGLSSDQVQGAIGAQ